MRDQETYKKTEGGLLRRKSRRWGSTNKTDEEKKRGMQRNGFRGHNCVIFMKKSVDRNR